MNPKKIQRGGILQGRYKTPQFEVFYNSLSGKVSMHDDLMQEGLLKEDKGIDSFISIYEPDIEIVNDSDYSGHVDILGLDISRILKDDVKARHTTIESIIKPM